MAHKSTNPRRKRKKADKPAFGPKYSRGAALLDAVLCERGIKQEVAQKQLGASRGQLSRWLRGQRSPMRWRTKIEKLFCVPSALWEELIPPPQTPQEAA